MGLDGNTDRMRRYIFILARMSRCTAEQLGKLAARQLVTGSRCPVLLLSLGIHIMQEDKQSGGQRVDAHVQSASRKGCLHHRIQLLAQLRVLDEGRRGTQGGRLVEVVR